MKRSKWESSAVWLSQSGQVFVPTLDLLRVWYKDWRASVPHEPITWTRIFCWQLLLLGLCSGAWLLFWGMPSSQPPGYASWSHVGLHSGFLDGLINSFGGWEVPQRPVANAFTQPCGKSGWLPRVQTGNCEAGLVVEVIKTSHLAGFNTRLFYKVWYHTYLLV